MILFLFQAEETGNDGGDGLKSHHVAVLITRRELCRGKKATANETEVGREACTTLGLGEVPMGFIMEVLNLERKHFRPLFSMTFV